MVIWFHLATAVLALGLGSANLVLAKGTPRHRVFGTMWIAAMLSVTVSSFWIRELRAGELSWIHGLTVWTLVSMGTAMWAIRTGRVGVHAGFMIGTMIGAFGAGRGGACAGAVHRAAGGLLSGSAAKAFASVHAAPCGQYGAPQRARSPSTLRAGRGNGPGHRRARYTVRNRCRRRAPDVDAR